MNPGYPGPGFPMVPPGMPMGPGMMPMPMPYGAPFAMNYGVPFQQMPMMPGGMPMPMQIPAGATTITRAPMITNPHRIGAPAGPEPMMSQMMPAPTSSMVITNPAVEKLTTVYVGKIAQSVEDNFILLVLQQCGSVASWKRVTDPISNQQRPFGFCKFDEPDGLVRAIRILNNFELDGSPLLLKVDDKTRDFLYKYEQAQKNAEGTEASDAVIVDRIRKLVAERNTGEFFDKFFSESVDTSMELVEGELVAGHEIDKHKAVLVTQEIKNFRVRQAIREREQAQDRKDEPKGPTGKEKPVDRELEKEMREREREKARIREQRMKERDREAKRRDKEDREYREREREWENREREKERERSRRERDALKDRERQIDKEYNFKEDSERDWKKRKERRRLAREQEEAEDEADRRRELEEIDSVRRAREEEERRREEEERRQEEEQTRLLEEYRRQQEERARQEEERRHLERYPPEPITIGFPSAYNAAPVGTGGGSPSESIEARIDRAKRLGFGLGGSSRKAPLVTPGFNPEEDPNPVPVSGKKKLTLIEPNKSEEQLRKEREEEAKNIVNMIPTDKATLFVYEMDWATIDEDEIVPKRIKPWIVRKIMEYLGEEDDTLIEFMVTKLNEHAPPTQILDQLAFVLEEEAEVFVIKLWRMLIFEMIRSQRARGRGEGMQVV